VQRLQEKLKVNEIFFSLQGESSHSGMPTIFLRLTGCNLRCSYCDTKYAYNDGELFSIKIILEKIKKYACKRVEITGGEPMEQKATATLANVLIDAGYEVMIETNGSFNLSALPDKVIKIVDIKTPQSGAGKSFLYDNLKIMSGKDEIKFVVCSKADYLWAEEEIKRHKLLSICKINISPVTDGDITAKELADLILKSGLDLRLNIQLHTIIGLP